MKRYWFRYPGMVYAGNVWAFSSREVRANLRAILNVNRLPNGTEIWS